MTILTSLLGTKAFGLLFALWQTASPSASPAGGNEFTITEMVEKPPREKAPSNLIITGRYILQPEIFDLLETQTGGAGGEIQITDSMIKLNGPHSVIGRSLMVHAKPDDFKTQQPPGNAGDRIGCGVIGIGDPKMMAH